MDLNLDVLERTERELRITLSHYFKQNGDMVADPDMEIRVYLLPDWKKAEALTYQDQFGYKEVYPEPDKVILNTTQEGFKQLPRLLAQELHRSRTQLKETITLFLFYFLC